MALGQRGRAYFDLMVEDGATSTLELPRDDADDLAWLTDHPAGYVISIPRGHNPADARVHHASCRTINGELDRGSTWVGDY